VKPQGTPYPYSNSSGHQSTGFDGWMPSVNELKPHPLNDKLYGLPKPDRKLVESIEKVGVLQPIVIDRNKQILAGHRRWEACRTIAERRPDKDFRIPATIFTGSDFQAEQLVIESNRQRVKTPEQKAREFRELKRIEAALAKERQLAAQNNKAARAVKASLPEQAKGQARDKAAEALGMGGRTAEKLLALVQKADAGDPEARSALDAVNEGRMSVDAAYRMAAAPKPERDAASIRKDEQTARDLSWLCKAHALDADVFQSEHEGRFRLTANNLTEAQVSKLLERLESFGGSTWTGPAPRTNPFSDRRQVDTVTKSLALGTHLT
jgi:ParB-like chromosome segregation protein Spo0J